MMKPFAGDRERWTSAWAASAVSLGAYWLLKGLEYRADDFEKDWFLFAWDHHHSHHAAPFTAHSWFGLGLSWAVWLGLLVLPYCFAAAGVGVLLRSELARRALVICSILGLVVVVLRLVEFPFISHSFASTMYGIDRRFHTAPPLQAAAILRTDEAYSAAILVIQCAVEAAYCTLLGLHLSSVGIRGAARRRSQHEQFSAS